MSHFDQYEDLKQKLNEVPGKIERAQQWVSAVATSVVTLLSGLAVLVTTFSADIASLAPEGYADDVTKWSLVVGSWLATAIAALRRVTPVYPEQRGVLPQSVDPQ